MFKENLKIHTIPHYGAQKSTYGTNTSLNVAYCPPLNEHFALKSER